MIHRRSTALEQSVKYFSGVLKPVSQHAKPTTSQFQVKHFTTKPPRSPLFCSVSYKLDCDFRFYFIQNKYYFWLVFNFNGAFVRN